MDLPCLPWSILLVDALKYWYDKRLVARIIRKNCCDADLDRQRDYEVSVLCMIWWARGAECEECEANRFRAGKVYAIVIINNLSHNTLVFCIALIGCVPEKWCIL